MMSEAKGSAPPVEVTNDALDQLFREARTHSAWLPKRVPVEMLRKAYDLARIGPTSANSCPARFVFLESESAKARLLPALAPTNVEKTKAAPVTAIVAWDTEFYDKLPQLFPHADMRSHFAGNQAVAEEQHSVTVRYREATSFLRLGPWDLIADLCPASIRAR